MSQALSGMCILPLSSIYCDLSCGRCNPALAQGNAGTTISAALLEGIPRDSSTQTPSGPLGTLMDGAGGAAAAPAESFISSFGPLQSMDALEVSEALK
jgi:hypothetical protein